jgi:predicted AAA+ superfamily ATPase
VFLVQTLKKYSPRLSVQEFGERKVFAIDNGLLNAVIFKFSADRGKAMEQVVFRELRRRGLQLFFLKNGFECDFAALSPSGRISALFQVCSDLGDPRTRERELKGIVTACKKTGLTGGTIVTYDQEDRIRKEGCDIRLVPLPVFLCEDGR